MTKFLTGVRAAKKPKMTNHRGRTWDTSDLYLPNGETTPAWFDTSWGERFYFIFDDRWYSAPVHFQIPGESDFDLRPERWAKSRGVRVIRNHNIVEVTEFSYLRD